MPQSITPQFLLYKKLLMYMAQKHKIKHAPIDVDRFFDTEKQQQAINQARDLLIQNPESEVISFCKSNPYQLNNHDLAIV
jgi:hypothetical protein